MSINTIGSRINTTGSSIKELLKKGATLLILLGMLLLLSVISPAFRTSNNIFNILEQNSVLGIMACGMAFMLITGGFDLSVGSTAALTGVIVGLILQASPGSLFLAIIAGLAVGALVGLVNGLMISEVGLNPFITTMGTMVIIRGLIFVITHGTPIFNFPMEYNVIGMGRLMGFLPVSMLIWAVVVGISFIVLRFTKFGQYIYAVGGNENVARLSGISVSWMKILSAMITSILASLGGIVLLFRVMSAMPNAATQYELYAIAAAVVGGCALGGGVGGAPGTIVGTLILGVIINGLRLIGISSYWESAVTGCVILLAVSIEVVSRKIASRVKIVDGACNDAAE